MCSTLVSQKQFFGYSGRFLVAARLVAKPLQDIQKVHQKQNYTKTKEKPIYPNKMAAVTRKFSARFVIKLWGSYSNSEFLAGWDECCFDVETINASCQKKAGRRRLQPECKYKKQCADSRGIEIENVLFHFATLPQINQQNIRKGHKQCRIRKGIPRNDSRH